MLLALCENYEKLIDDVLFLFNHARATWFWVKSIPHDSLNLVIWDFGVVKRIPWLTQIYASWLTQSLKECKSASHEMVNQTKAQVLAMFWGGQGGKLEIISYLRVLR